MASPSTRHATDPSRAAHFERLRTLISQSESVGSTPHEQQMLRMEELIQRATYENNSSFANPGRPGSSSSGGFFNNMFPWGGSKASWFKYFFTLGIIGMTLMKAKNVIQKPRKPTRARWPVRQMPDSVHPRGGGGPLIDCLAKHFPLMHTPELNLYTDDLSTIVLNEQDLVTAHHEKEQAKAQARQQELDARR